MSMVSEAYADLGGGLRSAQPLPRATRGVVAHHPIDRSPGRVCNTHMYDPVSGWCGCGLRDDGKLAEGSPAWRARLEQRMPEPRS